MSKNIASFIFFSLLTLSPEGDQRTALKKANTQRNLSGDMNQHVGIGKKGCIRILQKEKKKAEMGNHLIPYVIQHKFQAQP